MKLTTESIKISHADLFKSTALIRKNGNTEIHMNGCQVAIYEDFTVKSAGSKIEFIPKKDKK